jgi:hypothetical protein
VERARGGDDVGHGISPLAHPWAGEGLGVKVGDPQARRLCCRCFVSRQDAKAPRGSAYDGEVSVCFDFVLALRAGVLVFGAKRHSVI